MITEIACVFIINGVNAMVSHIRNCTLISRHHYQDVIVIELFMFLYNLVSHNILMQIYYIRQDKKREG